MKIVIFMKNWVGDTFFQLPAIRLIRQRYPEAHMTCIAPPRCRELLFVAPGIDEVLEFDEKSTHRSWLKRLQFVLELRRRGPWDQGYLFHRSKTRAMILALAGVKKRFGYAHGRDLWLTQSVNEPAPGLHHVDYFLELLRGLGFSIPGQTSYELMPSMSAAKKANLLLREVNLNGENHFVCFHLGANWMPKRWPVQSFAQLADLIHDYFQIPVIVTGSAHDESLWQAMQPAIQRATVHSFIGKTPLDVLAALYRQAAFVVSGDSGPLHIAAAVGTPVVALFGPTNPVLTGPRGSGETIVIHYLPAGQQAPFFGDETVAKTWLEQITPAQVFEAIRKKDWIR